MNTIVAGGEVGTLTTLRRYIKKCKERKVVLTCC